MAEEDKRLLQTNRIHTAAACIQCSYFIRVLNQLAEQTKARPKKLTVGLVGCGRLGTAILKSLLKNGDVKSSDVMVSTRCPQTLTLFSEQGVRVVYDNHQVAVASRVLLLCCLPAHLNTVAEEVKGCVPSECLVVSFLSGVTSCRVQSLLSCTHVVSCPQLPHWPLADRNPALAQPEAVTDLNGRDILVATCPVNSSFVPESCEWAVKVRAVLMAVWARWRGTTPGDHSTLDRAVFGTELGTSGAEQGTASRILEESFDRWSSHFSDHYCRTLTARDQ